MLRCLYPPCLDSVFLSNRQARSLMKIQKDTRSRAAIVAVGRLRALVQLLQHSTIMSPLIPICCVQGCVSLIDKIDVYYQSNNCSVCFSRKCEKNLYQQKVESLLGVSWLSPYLTYNCLLLYLDLQNIRPLEKLS